MQDNNWVMNIKKGKGKLPLFRGNGERVIPIYVGLYQTGFEYPGRSTILLV